MKLSKGQPSGISVSVAAVESMQMRQLFIQMSGAPGAGKTTLAQGIAPVLDAVIIDHDVSKTGLTGSRHRR